MNIDQLASALRHDEEFMNSVTAWKTIPPREGQLVDFPASMDRRMADVLKKRGINRLYTHQASAWEAAVQQKDYVVVTPTASGKTFCYNLPVLSAILKDQDSRALYLFPTKALALDQAGSLYELIEAMDVDVKAYTLRRRYAGGRTQGHPAGGAHRSDQSRYAAREHPAAPYQMGEAV